MELSKLATLNDSAGGYDWEWQKEAKALQEKAQAAEGVGVAEEDKVAKAALKLSMDNILMVSMVCALAGGVAVCLYYCVGADAVGITTKLCPLSSKLHDHFFSVSNGGLTRLLCVGSSGGISVKDLRKPLADEGRPTCM